MTHHQHHSHHGHGGSPPARRMGGRHALRLFALNAVLYVACGAFAGLIARDYLPSPIEMKAIAAFFGVPLLMAVISTVVHMKAQRWTSVDDMAERL